MSTHVTLRRNAFTLIELLVVIAIILKSAVNLCVMGSFGP